MAQICDPSFLKHFINAVSETVVRGLRSIASQDPSLRVIESEKVLYRQQDLKKVLLLSGGGSGHEPAHAGYVSQGMLDICVAGEIFASPSATQVLAGFQALPSPKGILMIVRNYTGDKLNFGLAAKKAKAVEVQVNVVFVGDDVSVEGNELVGRRGLAGVVFVHKIAGAVASAGGTLDEVTTAAQKAADQLFTVGVSLDRCDVPSRELKEGLPHGELEYGMGIHNEPGVRRANIPMLSVTISNLLQLLEPSTQLLEHKRVAVMINNLDGLSVLELNIVANKVITQLRVGGFDLRRIVVGTFVSSLNGPGFSVTILRLSQDTEKSLNAETKVANWPNFIGVPYDTVIARNKREAKSNVAATIEEVEEVEADSIMPISSKLAYEILSSIVASVSKDEPQITHYDTLAGDGDCGETLLKSVQAAAASIEPFKGQILGLHEISIALTRSVESSTGGTSGAIYAIFFNALSNSIRNTPQGSRSMTAVIAKALSAALLQLFTYTTARRGHKTLMDALIPFVEVFSSTLDVRAAVEAANEGTQATRNLTAVLGRASYVGEEAFNVDGGIPDHGALGVLSVLKGIEAVVGRC